MLLHYLYQSIAQMESILLHGCIFLISLVYLHIYVVYNQCCDEYQSSQLSLLFARSEYFLSTHSSLLTQSFVLILSSIKLACIYVLKNLKSFSRSAMSLYILKFLFKLSLMSLSIPQCFFEGPGLCCSIWEPLACV